MDRAGRSLRLKWEYLGDRPGRSVRDVIQIELAGLTGHIGSLIEMEPAGLTGYLLNPIKIEPAGLTGYIRNSLIYSRPDCSEYH